MFDSLLAATPAALAVETVYKVLLRLLVAHRRESSTAPQPSGIELWSSGKSSVADSLARKILKEIQDAEDTNLSSLPPEIIERYINTLAQIAQERAVAEVPPDAERLGQETLQKLAKVELAGSSSSRR